MKRRTVLGYLIDSGAKIVDTPARNVTICLFESCFIASSQNEDDTTIWSKENQHDAVLSFNEKRSINFKQSNESLVCKKQLD